MARISCNKLWKRLIDQERKKPAFALLPLQKLGKGDNITTDVLLRIWEVMDCHIENILETTGE